MKKLALFAVFAFAAGAAFAEEAKPAADAWKSKTFTAEELKKFDGKNGQPSYVAANGIVYDVSAHKGWKTGMHMGHKAGMDLTKMLEKAPKAMHGEKNFAKYPKVGVLKAEEAPAKAEAAPAKSEEAPAKAEPKKEEKPAKK